MSDLQSLLAVVGLLYLSECCAWLPRSALMVRTWWRRRWRVAFPSSLLGNQRHGLCWAQPLPPLGGCLVSAFPQVSLSPKGVLGFVSASTHPAGRPEQSGRYWDWAEIQEIRVAGRSILVNGQRLVRAATLEGAWAMKGWLLRLKSLDAAGRQSALESQVRRSLDRSELELRWRQFQAACRWLEGLTNGLWSGLFVVAPLCGWYFGFQRVWWWWLPAWLAIHVATAIQVLRLHRVWYPESAEPRLNRFLHTLFLPLAAIRAKDALSRPLLESFHPALLARVFCPDPEFVRLARRVWLDWRHPAQPHCPVESEPARQTESSFRALVLEELERLLQREGFNLEAWARPPRPLESTCQSYCPRCEAQFTFTQGVCRDCGGLETRPLERAETPRRASRSRADAATGPAPPPPQ